MAHRSKGLPSPQLAQAGLSLRRLGPWTWQPAKECVPQSSDQLNHGITATGSVQFTVSAKVSRPRGRRWRCLRDKSSVWPTTVPGVCRMTLLLLASGYLGLRIVALEAQLKSLGALTELLLHSREWVGVHSSQNKSSGQRGAGRTLSRPPLVGKKNSRGRLKPVWLTPL